MCSFSITLFVHCTKLLFYVIWMVSMNKATYLYIYLLVTVNLKRMIVLIIIVMYIETEFYSELGSNGLLIFYFFLASSSFSFFFTCVNPLIKKIAFPLFRSLLCWPKAYDDCLLKPVLLLKWIADKWEKEDWYCFNTWSSTLRQK